MSAAAVDVTQLAPFRNEPYTDFNRPENAAKMRTALKQVRAQFCKEYKLFVTGKYRGAAAAEANTFESVNPSRPSEVIGIHQEASIQDADDAVQGLFAYFPHWSARPMEERVNLTLRVASIIRDRKNEFNAWLVYESGKSWAEAEADVSEAIDFCEYYARLALKLERPDPLVQLPGERDQLVYLPLGVGAIIPPWNFPLAIVAGMTIAALVTGNTVVLKPSSDTPTIAAKFVEVLLDAGFPAESFAFLTGSGTNVGERLVQHPKVRFVSFTGSKAVGLLINERAAHTPAGQPWMKRIVAEMGGKDATVIDKNCDLDEAVLGVAQAAFSFQGQKCSACSRAIVDEAIYDEFLEKLKAKAETLTIGPAEDVQNYMGPVINTRARKKILDYIEIGNSEGRLVTGGKPADGDGYFIQPTVFADVEPSARIFQEEIFGPVLAVSKSRDFDHALELANATEYGLTGAVYTLDREKIEKAKREFFVGNLYINRKCTGAMVGAHPFGGFNMSGTDSKAGGPDYLLQFVQGKSIAEKIV
ncbi:MAG TPA: L-glutamate gamma-semialdehyde dehydrogenase [Bryobacteraceae bacterium]|jgi:1-pyrroline-5-carboxylate dehydrogenase|nr:L-glutamate gamma-semialdehyde dehydrogenase [Bryobacteraceae bacterium]